MNTTVIRAAGLVAVLIASASLSACTWRTEHKVETVSKIDAHIVLDIRQIKADANQIEDYVRKDDTATTKSDQPASYLDNERFLRGLANEGSGSWLKFSPEARAQTPAAQSPVSGDDERKALEGRKARLKTVNEALDKGDVGESDQGLLEAIAPKDSPAHAAAAKLAAEENADRKTIYRALAEKQGAASAEKAVGAVFAGEIRSKLKKGQHFQVPRDKDLFAEFQKTPLGQAHAAAKPGEWVAKAIDPEKKG